MKFFLLICSVLIVFPYFSAQAEPWISNRFAENCAGCHAPGRLNRKPKDRRCTLSCQGCHVNPNGGGIRNFYGQWNSQRWLRSFYSKMTWNQKSTAPFKAQKYAKKKLPKKRKLLYAAKGAKLVEIPRVVTNENAYKDHTNYKKTARNKLEDMLYITENDPYRLERQVFAYSSGDLRLFYLQQGGDDQDVRQELTEGATFFPMAFDVGVRVRPLRESLSFVYEARAANASLESSMDKLFGTGSVITRSAYVLLDDLPYNSYVQYGFYRPMIGIYNPNHENLATQYHGIDQNARFKAIGFGMAPNVPFVIFNLIQRSSGASGPNLGEEGFVVTAGARAVTLGMSAQATYWSTRTTGSGAETRKTIFEVNGGIQFWRFTGNGSIMQVDKQSQARRDKATVITAESKLRLWREVYLQANYTTGNVGLSSDAGTFPTGFAPGSGTELSYGLKAFLLSGMELELLMSNFTRTIEDPAVPDPVTTNKNIAQLQLHFFW